MWDRWLFFSIVSLERDLILITVSFFDYSTFFIRKFFFGCVDSHFFWDIKCKPHNSIIDIIEARTQGFAFFCAICHWKKLRKKEAKMVLPCEWRYKSIFYRSFHFAYNSQSASLIFRSIWVCYWMCEYECVWLNNGTEPHIIVCKLRIHNVSGRFCFFCKLVNVKWMCLVVAICSALFAN